MRRVSKRIRFNQIGVADMPQHRGEQSKCCFADILLFRMVLPPTGMAAVINVCDSVHTVFE